MTARRSGATSLLRCVAIAGAGRAGSALAAALVAARTREVRLWSRDRARARRSARRSGVRLAPDLPGLLDGAGVIIVAVRDDALEEVARRIARAWPDGSGPEVALHLAGAHSASCLDPLRGSGARAGVFHPVVSLTGAASRHAFRGGAATISGDALARRTARALALSLGMEPVLVEDDARPLVHLAAVMAAGDATALLGGAAELLVASGVAPVTARRLLASLARSSIAGFERSGAERAMTGPVPRADARTLTRHLEGLSRAGVPLASRRLIRDAHLDLVRLATAQLLAAGRISPRERRAVLRALVPRAD